MFKDNKIIALLEKIDTKLGQILVLQKGKKIKSIVGREGK